MIIDYMTNPGLIFLFSAVVICWMPLNWRRCFTLLIPIITFFYIISLNPGDTQTINYMGYEFVLLRVDKLSLVWGYIFCIAAALGIIYSFHQNDRIQDVAAIIYSGSAVGAVFAGDLISLFIFWEFTAISSVFLIWASRSESSYYAGLRYLVIQLSSGLILLAGVILWAHSNGQIAFNLIGIDSLAGKLIFLAFGIKCAFPLLHNWLQDSYPQSTESGTVILSAFTTKLAVYALARGFSGTEELIFIGATMTAFPIFFAVIENDLRKVLAYSLNNQLGFMVVGVGIGTELSLNGTACHAFVHILYKALLFMSMGAVLHRLGTTKATELGGLYKSMPLTTVFCIVGAMSISAFPLFSGFVAKSMILTAAAGEGYWGIWLVLVMGSAGVMHHSGIKIPYFAFFSHDSGKRPKEAPTNMLIAMGITAILCIYFGVYPYTLYSILPYPVDFSPYTFAHVITQLQLLMFSILAFIFLMKVGTYPPEVASTNLDTDILYRKFIPKILNWFSKSIYTIISKNQILSDRWLEGFVGLVKKYHGLDGVLAKTHPAGFMVSCVVGLLCIYLLLYLFG